MVKMELPKLEDFLKRLQRSWKAAKKLMEMVKEAIKKQFNKKRYNLQGLKLGDIMSRTKEVDLIFSYFLFSFYFPFDLFSLFYF